jgi:hypothetical protein
MDTLCRNKRPFQTVLNQETALNEETNRTKKLARNIYDTSENWMDSFASVTWSRLKTVMDLGNEQHAEHPAEYIKRLNTRISSLIFKNALSAFPPDALYSIFPIQLELTKENLELHEAFLTQSFTLSDKKKLAAMHVQRYIDQQFERIHHPYSTHINSSSQACGIFSTCGVNSCTKSGDVIERGIDEIENEFCVKQYPYDAAHDPLLPCCPPITTYKVGCNCH